MLDTIGAVLNHDETYDFFKQIVTLSSHKALDACNASLAQQGLRLASADIVSLQESRVEALGASGQVEVGGGILPELSAVFASSPYLRQEDLLSTLAGLQDAFYEFRRQADVDIPDTDLLDAMRVVFDTQAAGNVEFMENLKVDELLSVTDDTADDLSESSSIEGGMPEDIFGNPDRALPLPWNEDRWMDSFESDGWSGEKWVDAHEQ